MTSICSRPTVEHAATAAEAVRALNHLTLGRGALGEPAELDRLVAELAIMAGRLPQLLRQLRGWLDAEQHAGRLRTDDTTDPARIVDRAAAELAEAGHAAHHLGRALDDAHQLLAHLAVATEPDRTHQPGRSNATAGTDGRSGPRDGRAETVATSGHFHGHQRAGFMAASGQKPMSLDKHVHHRRRHSRANHHLDDRRHHWRLLPDVSRSDTRGRCRGPAGHLDKDGPLTVQGGVGRHSSDRAARAIASISRDVQPAHQVLTISLPSQAHEH